MEIAWCLAASLVAMAGLAWRWRRQRAALAAELARVDAQRRDWHRLLRVTAADLRGPALGLLGHAEQLPAALRPSLIGVCRYLLDLAEALAEQTEEPGRRRRLREEEVAVGPLVDFAMAQVAAGLGPGRRVWRLAPELDRIAVFADRRALHQILVRLLTSAALATGDGDWIAVGAQATEAGLTLVIEDEGTGLAVEAAPDAPGAGEAGRDGGVAPAHAETRGLGIGLSLVRSLIAAHGGSLAIDSAARVGTRVMLNFPATRVLHAPTLGGG